MKSPEKRTSSHHCRGWRIPNGADIRPAISIALLAATLLLCACSKAGRSPEPASTPYAKMTLTSPAFQDGATLPREFTCDGAGTSPPLAWSSVPSAAKNLALIMDDPDAPGGLWVHWVVFDLPPDSTGLPANVPPEQDLEHGGQQGTNSYRKQGYGAACPPPGDKPHRYFFRLYALDSPVAPGPRATRDQLIAVMQGHILAEGQLVATYNRP